MPYDAAQRKKQTIGKGYMLYQLNQLQNAALTPVRLWAETGQHVFSNPWNPLSYTPQGRAFAAACHVFEHSTRPHPKPSFGLDSTVIDGREVAVREQIVRRRPFCQLRHFARDTGREDPQLLIVAPLSGHFATLLRGTVGALLPDHDIYITDWRDARNVPVAEGAFDLDDYIDYIVDYLSFLGPDTHVLAVCQPAVPVLAAVALMSAENHPALPASMTLMGGPIDTRRNPTTPNKLATSHSLDWFERTVIMRVPYPYRGQGRRVYPGFLQLSGFMTMNLDRHIDAHVKLYHHLIRGDGESAQAHRDFYEEYRAVMDLPAEYYLQTIRTVFQEHALPRHAMMHRDRHVDTTAIRNTALMTVEGELDDISGIGQTRAAHDICPNIPEDMRMHWEQKGVGHYGVFNGRRWRQEIAPRVTAFIRAHMR